MCVDRGKLPMTERPDNNNDKTEWDVHPVLLSLGNNVANVHYLDNARLSRLVIETQFLTVVIKR